MAEKIQKPDSEWRDQLTEEQYEIARQKGTERAFTGEFNDCKDEGMYVCRCCGAQLFSSDDKFDSGSGWPSFTKPEDGIDGERVQNHEDRTLGMLRTEVTCNRCDAHLGHVFPDGPNPTGLRYCINSASLDLKRK